MFSWFLGGVWVTGLITLIIRWNVNFMELIVMALLVFTVFAMGYTVCYEEKCKGRDRL